MNTTLVKCSERAGENIPQWDGVLYGKMVVPFVDMTVKMFLWYQGEVREILGLGWVLGLHAGVGRSLLWRGAGPRLPRWFLPLRVAEQHGRHQGQRHRERRVRLRDGDAGLMRTQSFD